MDDSIGMDVSMANPPPKPPPKDVSWVASAQISRIPRHPMGLFNPEYTPDIVKGYFDKESRHPVIKDYFSKVQKDVIKSWMRTTLLSWMLEIHERFHMAPQALWLAQWIVDRVLSKKRIKRDELQKMGSAALWISSKYWDIIVPRPKEFVYMAANCFTVDEMVECEASVLKLLNHNVVAVTPYQFAEVFIHVAQTKITDVKRKDRVK